MKRCGRRDSYPSIDLRPEIVEARDRLGDYERDTIVGSGMHKGPVLLAIVDRASRRVHIAKLPKVDANFAHQATVRLIKDSPVLTITNDNGPEFADYTRTASILNAPVYFNDPYASWQRGTNENTNGLIRQYFPRGTDFSNVTEEEIQQVEQKLNNRPRKIHGY
jgi:IS30 family transposase